MTPAEILRANLEPLLDRDPRSPTALARDAAAQFPGRGPDAWRKGILRTIGSGETQGNWWPTEWAAEGLAWLLGVKLGTLYAEVPKMTKEGVPVGFYIDDQSEGYAARFVGTHDKSGWCGPERDAFSDAQEDCMARARNIATVRAIARVPNCRLEPGEIKSVLESVLGAL